MTRETDELRELTRDAHAAAKDLSAALREFNRVKEQYTVSLVQMLEKLLATAGEHVMEQVNAYIANVAKSALLCVMCPSCQRVMALLAQDNMEHQCECGATFTSYVKIRAKEDLAEQMAESLLQAITPTLSLPAALPSAFRSAAVPARPAVVRSDAGDAIARAGKPAR